MRLPNLSDWEDTRNSLHQALRILSVTRVVDIDPLPNELQYSTIPTATGATTGVLKSGGELSLDFVQATIMYRRDGTDIFSVDLQGHNQKSLAETVFIEFDNVGITITPNWSKVEATTPFGVDKDQAQAFSEMMWRMLTSLARLKGRLYGGQTPLVLWAHGFDLSTLWFLDGMDEQQDPHINFGFSPGTSDVGQPYTYCYAWPVPEGLENRLPANVIWNAAWSTPGCILPYDRFATEDNPEGIVTDTLLEVYRVASEMMK